MRVHGKVLDENEVWEIVWNGAPGISESSEVEIYYVVVLCVMCKYIWLHKTGSFESLVLSVGV